MHSIKISAIIASLFILCFGTLAAASNNAHVVIVVAGSISIRDISDPSLHNLCSLMNSGSAALMNVRTGRPSKDVELTLKPGMEPGCISIGAGSMAVGGGEARRAYNTSKKIDGITAAQLYQCRTGIEPYKSEIVNTEIEKMRMINDSALYRAKIGCLGTLLHNAGIKTAVIGNSDTPGQIHREAASIAMDENGLVDYGCIDDNNLTIPQPESPCGIQTNQAYVVKQFQRIINNSGLVIIDFGDTFRADDSSGLCTYAQAKRVRHNVAVSLDKFISKIANKLDFSKDMLILLCPSSRTYSDIDEERLTPIVIKGPGFEHGMLDSPSTHRHGLVTIVDIAPTILRFFNIKPSVDMVGRPITNTPHSNTIKTLNNMNIDACFQGQRQVAMRGSSVLQSIIVIAVTLIMMIGCAVKFKRIAAWLVLVPIVLPIAMLYLPLFYSGGLIGAIFWLIVITALIICISMLLFHTPQKAMVWLCGFILLSVFVDMIRGAALTSESITGYSMLEGARYYGIGNELMGTALGAAIIGIGMAFSGNAVNKKYRGWIAAIVFALTCIFIGAPCLGANVGGALAAVPAVIFALLLRRGYKLSIRNILLVAAATIVIIGSMFVFDAMRLGSAQSHAGRIVGLLTSGDSRGIFFVFERKIELNLMLLSTSMWSRLIGFGLLGSALLFLQGRKKIGSNYLNIEDNAAAIACLIGILCAFAFNDSGVVAAGTCVVFLWAMFALKSFSTQ